MDVMNVEQAKIAEAAGAVAVMALERIPADIRRDGGVARMSDPALIKEIKNAVTIPVMAKARIGHFVEAQILEACEIDYIDESEVLTMADDVHHTDKTQFSVPFVCGCRNLGEALRRVGEGAAMLRTKGEAGTGNIVAITSSVGELVSRFIKVDIDARAFIKCQDNSWVGDLLVTTDGSISRYIHEGWRSIISNIDNRCSCCTASGKLIANII